MLLPTRWPKPPEVTRPETSPSTRTGSLPRQTARGRRGRGSAGGAAVRCVACVEQGVAADEAAGLVEPHGEAEPGLVGRRLGGDVASPRPGSPSPAASSRSRGSRPAHALRAAPPPAAGPTASGRTRRGVELPAELADEGDPLGEDGHRADGDRPGPQERERIVREVGVGERLEDVPGRRPPQAQAAARRR